MNAFKFLLKKSPKSSTLTKLYYEEGSSFFQQKKYVEALISYNKCLVHAKSNPVDLANGFTGRSAVYFVMKNFEKCLQNIKLAREQNILENDMRLDDREARCKEYLKIETKDTECTYKLSNAPNPRIPFLVSGLELSQNDKFGRYIKTSRDLRPGEVIAIEEPSLRFIDLKANIFYKYRRCFNCFKSNELNLLPGSHEVMTCSQTCYDSIKDRDFDSEALIEGDLSWKVLKMIQLKNKSLAVAGDIDSLTNHYYSPTKTIFNFDFNSLPLNETKKVLLKCTVSLIGGTTGRTDDNVDAFKHLIGSYSNQRREFLVTFVEHMMNVCQKTQFSLNTFDESLGQWVKVGNCLLPFGGLLNHSCDPNVFWISLDGKFVFIVTKPIKADEQLFICYRKTFLREGLTERRKSLLAQYGFVCDCEACHGNYGMGKTEETPDDNLGSEQFTDIESIDAEVARNWEQIETKFGKESPHRIAGMIAKNKFLLEIARSKIILHVS
ncbi:SET and MYND domain-containing protein 4 [Pseudolycoriella hygida]|uniref:SET and MYND domain-containing protein 4 n=1 Tax=Pseudolycoriella hygida TaxID=35572 RepID=A0A9Q0NH91_9DIPT|nr:SET and MYND domain-containing protein 4 [Pseudolycoriella hygida]